MDSRLPLFSSLLFSLLQIFEWSGIAEIRHGRLLLRPRIPSKHHRQHHRFYSKLVSSRWAYAGYDKCLFASFSSPFHLSCISRRLGFRVSYRAVKFLVLYESCRQSIQQHSTRSIHFTSSHLHNRFSYRLQSKLSPKHSRSRPSSTIVRNTSPRFKTASWHLSLPIGKSSSSFHPLGFN